MAELDLIQTMRARDVNAARLARCYATISEQRYLMMMAKNLKATAKKNKKEVAILGKTASGHKGSGWVGSGSMTIYFVTSMFVKLMKQYKETGEDTYFDMQIINSDPTSASGSQILILKDCNMDSAVLAAFDADGDWLEQDTDFTFEDFELPQGFTELDGVKL